MKSPNPIGKELDQDYGSIQKSIREENSEPALIIDNLLFGVYADMLTIESKLVEIASYADISGFKVKVKKKKKK